MGYSNSVVEESLKQQKFDDCYASYLLLGKRNTDVSFIKNYWNFILILPPSQFLFQLDSEGSRSGSSLSLRAMAPGVGGQSGQPAPSPAHSGNTGAGAGHRGVQRSISATSGNKPRRGSTGAEKSTPCELTSGPGSGTKEGANGGESNGGQGWILFRPRLVFVFYLVSLEFLFSWT